MQPYNNPLIVFNLTGVQPLYSERVSTLIAYLRERSDKLKGLGMTSGLGPRP